MNNVLESSEDPVCYACAPVLVILKAQLKALSHHALPHSSPAISNL